MTFAKRMSGLIVVMIILSLALPNHWLKEVDACSCVMPGTVLEELEKSDVVFDGIVASGKRASFMSTDMIWTFKPSGFWKGDANGKLKV